MRRSNKLLGAVIAVALTLPATAVSAVPNGSSQNDAAAGLVGAIGTTGTPRAPVIAMEYPKALNKEAREDRRQA